MSKQSRDQGRAQRAAAIRAAQARKERNRRVALIAAIVVMLGAIVAAGAWYGGGGGSKDPQTSSSTPALAAGATSLEMGNAKAPVKVVIYEDFLCPYCRELESSTRDFLRENAAKGRVYVEYQPINLLQTYDYSARSLNAWAAVLKHATPAAALKLHDLFYENQPYEESSSKVSDSQIADWVKKAGGDNTAVQQAMKTRDTEFFAVLQDLMASANIQSTPTVFIDDKQLTNMSVQQMVSAVEQAVDQGS